MSNSTLPAIVRGDDYPLQFTFTEAGAPVDVTGWKIRVMVKENLADADVDAKYDAEVTGGAPDAASGLIRAPIPAASTVNFPVGPVSLQARREIPGSPSTYRTLLLLQHRVLESVIQS